LRRLEGEVGDLRTVVIDASGIDDLDATADHVLRTTVSRYHESGIEVGVVNVNGSVREVMVASGLAGLVGDDHFFATDADAIAHLERGDR
jgi:SulP family sulfate permease